jgi:membrane protease subunit HflC
MPDDHGQHPDHGHAGQAPHPARAASGHEHCDHDHDHDHHHHHDHAPLPGGRPWLRWSIAAILVAAALAAACLVTVRAGSAVVVTRLGDPVRVLTAPGLAWRWPAPLERTTTVDLRLHTSASGLHTVLTRDGLSLVAQAAVVWRLPAEPAAVLRFLRSVQGDPQAAEDQLRGQLGAALEAVTGRFALADLLTVGEGQTSRLAEYEQELARAVQTRAGDLYGITIAQVGLERFGLPESTVAATVARMAAERDTVAAERKAQGERQAGEIEAEADKQARLLRATAKEEAATIAGKGQAEAAAITRAAYAADPALFEFIRGLDTLDEAITAGTRLVLRTDAAPFKALVEAPAPTGSAAP